ncbi:hypothetical protein AWM68_15930 [Fictibacillus phosphorivorans]|uniref:Uncharacterized protein n=1 Tax=Fictibacillus phosphorivorans TaxID=1221500 RepID=A0A165MT99_9BACL|nr:hypothetical protein [Fictibacillus phosphorivorans]KZE63282.1 hypothetical protein AWM68_15930 [Fictibacillus phosphorivorans]
MKKVLSMVFAFCLVASLGVQKVAADNNFELSKSEISVLSIPNVLRYDFLITNNTPSKGLKHPEFRGHYYPQPSMEIAVIPGKKLSSVMSRFPRSSTFKLNPVGGSSNGDLRTQKKVLFSVEYEIKKNTDLKKVREYATDSTVIIFDGLKEVAEFPLNK